MIYGSDRFVILDGGVSDRSSFNGTRFWSFRGCIVVEVLLESGAGGISSFVFFFPVVSCHFCGVRFDKKPYTGLPSFYIGVQVASWGPYQ